MCAEASLKFEAIGTCVHLPARTVLINEGFVAEHVFVICSGSFKLVASSAGGRTLLLRVARAGDVIGLEALAAAARYRITAATLDASTVLSIPRIEFVRMMKESIELSMGISVAIARDYHSAFQSARRLGLSGSAAGRLANALLDWARMDDADGQPVRGNLPITFAMPLTHEELGSMAGISRETVTRLLKKFRHEGLVGQNEQQMILHHPDRLEHRYC